jgi:hypothetical protein
MWTLPPLWTQRTRPQGFGNLAKEREIPTASTSIIFFSLKNKKNEEHNHSDQPSTKSDHPHTLFAISRAGCELRSGVPCPQIDFR